MLGSIEPTDVDANDDRPLFYVTYVPPADGAYVVTADIEHTATAPTISGKTITVHARPPADPLPQAKYQNRRTGADLMSGVSAAFVLVPADTARPRTNDSIVRAWARDFEQLGRDLGHAIGMVHERAVKEHG